MEAEAHWSQVAPALVAAQLRAALSVPVELAPGPIGTLEVYAAGPRDWNDREVAALQADAGVVASLLRAAAAATVKGELAEQLQWALQHRILIEQAKGVLMEREGLSPAAAFTGLRIRGSRGGSPAASGATVMDRSSADRRRRDVWPSPPEHVPCCTLATEGGPLRVLGDHGGLGWLLGLAVVWGRDLRVGAPDGQCLVPLRAGPLQQPTDLAMHPTQVVQQPSRNSRT
jgi:hypothetical protein